MVSVGVAVARQVERIYEEGADPPFADVVRWIGPATDADLADLIEADGCARVRHRLGVGLDRYLSDVVDLAARIEPLDAAIDVALRSLSARGLGSTDAVRALVAQHPALEEAIREAAALNEAVLSTASLHRVLTERPAPRPLPDDFGPVLADGRRRYQLTSLLGSGSGGQVYKATDRLLSEAGHEAVVAIKIITGLESTPWARQKFMEEATKARRILNPHVVRVIDRGGDGSTPEFIVYEYVPGGDLQQFGTGKPRLTQEEVVRLVAGIAAGIQAAHSAGVVHCDLKPSNIVLGDDGAPMVADFGIAVRQSPMGPERSSDDMGVGAPVGNLAFIAPEQFRMEPGAHAPAADVYAIGGIMYWLATKVLPNGRSVAEIERTHDPLEGRKVPPSIRVLRADADRELDLICARCMAPDPAHRYGSAAQLVDDLTAWQRRQPIPWTRPTLRRVIALWMRRRPGVAVSLASLVVTLGVAGATTLTFWHQADIARAEVHTRDTERALLYSKLDFLLKSATVLGEQSELWEIMPIFPYIEWAQGTTVLGDPLRDIPVWEDRISIVRVMLAYALRAGGPMDFEALCLESTLAFWLLCDGRVEEARALLPENRRKWQELAPGATRWLTWLDGIVSCSDIALADAAVARDPSAPIDRVRLASAGDRLIQVRAELTIGPSQRALQGLIDRSLEKLYGPNLLDDPMLARKYGKPEAKGAGGFLDTIMRRLK